METYLIKSAKKHTVNLLLSKGQGRKIPDVINTSFPKNEITQSNNNKKKKKNVSKQINKKSKTKNYVPK